MSGPCYDWTPVGYPSHPIPGQPDMVASSAAIFRQTSEHLTGAARALRRLDGEDTISEAFAKLRSNAAEIAGLLEQAHDRYRSAADALGRYAPELAKAQYDAEQALQAGTAARHSYDQARSSWASFTRQARASVDPQERTELLHASGVASNTAHDSLASLKSARARIAAAIQHRDQAANAARSAIDASIADRELNDGFFDHLQELWHDAVELGKAFLESNPLLKAIVEGIKDAAQWVWDHIDEIALALTIAAFVLGWVPGLGQLVAVLALLARAAALISKVKMVLTLTTAAAKGVRTGDWGDLAKAGTGVLIGYGVGKAFKAFAGRVSEKSWRIVRDESVRATGNLNKIAITLDRTRPVQRSAAGKVVHYFTGDNPLAPVTQQGRNVDTLTHQFTRDVLGSRATDASVVSHLVDNGAVQDMVKEAVEPAKDAVSDWAGDQAHRLSAQECREPVPAGRGASGGW